MSLIYTRAVWESKIDPPGRWLLLALADYARDDGHCWPGVRALATRLRAGERSVYRWIRLAEKAGYLRRISGGGARKTNHYWLDLAAMNPVTGDTVSGPETVSRAARNAATEDTGTLSRGAGEPSVNHHEPPTVDGRRFSCPECGAEANLKVGRYGRFVGCSKYPVCRWTEAAPPPMPTPREIEASRELGRRLAEAQWQVDYPEPPS